MCIIVDTNRMSEFLCSQKKEDVAPIHQWLKKRHGFLIYSTGDKFSDEVKHKARKILQQFMNAGYAKLVPSHEFIEDAKSLRENATVKSDDYHVLALARATSARILFTSDKNLIKDFTNKTLVDNPRGKIYSGKQNRKELLQNWRCSSSV